MQARRIFAVESEVSIIQGGLARGRVADHRGRLEGQPFGDVESRIPNGGARGRHGELREAIHCGELLGLEKRFGVEPGNLRGDARAQPFAAGDRERADGGMTLHKRRPEIIEATSRRGYDSDPRDDDAVHAAVLAPTSPFTAAEICSIVSSFPNPPCVASPLPAVAVSFAL